MKICFMIHHHTPLAQAANALALVNASLELKHHVNLGFIDSLAYHHGDVRAEVAVVETPLSNDMTFDALKFTQTVLAGFDVIWVLSLGPRESFLDNIQLLKLLAAHLRVINSPESLLCLHSKISLAGVEGIMKYPQSYISPDPEKLWGIVKESKAAWVVKPLTESFGRNVFKLMPGDSNIRPLLQAMTGHNGSRHCLLQRFLPEVANGEKRVLLAGGDIVGQYVRKATHTDHRGNVHQGAETALCELTSDERAACKRVAAYLIEQGVYFAGLDVAWPWLLEWNVVSPGGIVTIEKLGGVNLAKTVVEKVLSASEARKPQPAAAEKAAAPVAQKSTAARNSGF